MDFFEEEWSLTASNAYALIAIFTFFVNVGYVNQFYPSAICFWNEEYGNSRNARNMANVTIIILMGLIVISNIFIQLPYEQLEFILFFAAVRNSIFFIRIKTYTHKV